MIPQYKLRIRILLFTLVITILGFGSKLYCGAGSHWFNNSLAGLFYETFWCLIVFLVNPGLKALTIGVWVLGITSILEVMQLWHPAFLQTIRSTFIGAALLGNSFNWLDFPYYLAGCALGVVMIYYLNQQNVKKSNEIH